LDLTPVIKSIEWNDLITILTNPKKIDTIIAKIIPRPAGAQTFAFTDEYYASAHVIVLAYKPIYTNADFIDVLRCFSSWSIKNNL